MDDNPYFRLLDRPHISKKQSIEWIENFKDPKGFHHLMEVFLEGNYRQVQNASFMVMHLFDSSPGLIQPYLTKMIDLICNKNPINAVRRNVMRVFQSADIPVSHEGELTDIAFKYLNSAHEPVANKVFAMTVLYRMTLKYPELGGELKFSIESQMPFGASGFKNRGKKILSALSSQKTV
ncbi:MAG TPA: hypothetical protein DDY13_17335 [Cytophagales bacterium]|jgi:hypothetical protein|nr:hypothetical protein [Cytophagales bacterium]